MSTTQRRIGVLSGALVTGVGIVLFHLFGIMVMDHDVWARRSHENRWTFRAVPSVRGVIRDRDGVVLVHDEPTMELSLYYRRFRLWHPVGAAVHGATALARLSPDREGTTYSYSAGVLGPEAAARDLLAMPVTSLRAGRYSKEITAELAVLATTVLSTCSGLPRKRVFAAMRAAAQRGDPMVIGDVLSGHDSAQLFDAFMQALEALRRLDVNLLEERRNQAMRRGALGAGGADTPILFGELERLRKASLAGERVTRIDASGNRVPGDEIESIAWPFVDHVPFELAASVRVGARRHPGLEANPSIQRIGSELLGTSLAALLGPVLDFDRIHGGEDMVSAYVDEELPAELLDEMVPVAAVPDPEERERMQLEAKSRLKRAMMLDARRGVSGIEAGFDDELSGRHGFRLVERDARRHEQQLWSNLAVRAGADVSITIDLLLQRLAEPLVRDAQAKLAARHADPAAAARCEASLAVIDARSGDILAMVGAPVHGNNPRSVPGITWRVNGALGSVVKPFVLLEQLHAEAGERPHSAMSSFEPCSGRFDYGGVRLRCDGVHGDRGRHAVSALAESCNCFFYQCAEGLGEAGLAQAMRRVGLLQPAQAGDPMAAAWQERPRGMPVVMPRWVGKEMLPRRAIGYSVEASPLSVARAYAALATGSLPTLGIDLGVRRPSVPLAGLESELQVVREGLLQCVQSGTARRVEALAKFHVLGKTGTAEVGERDHENNAWFAGFLDQPGPAGAQLCLCAVIYWVPDGVHGGEAAGHLVGGLLTAVAADPVLAARYLGAIGGGR